MPSAVPFGLSGASCAADGAIGFIDGCSGGSCCGVAGFFSGLGGLGTFGATVPGVAFAASEEAPVRAPAFFGFA